LPSGGLLPVDTTYRHNWSPLATLWPGNIIFFVLLLLTDIALVCVGVLVFSTVDFFGEASDPPVDVVASADTSTAIAATVNGDGTLSTNFERQDNRHIQIELVWLI